MDWRIHIVFPQHIPDHVFYILRDCTDFVSLSPSKKRFFVTTFFEIHTEEDPPDPIYDCGILQTLNCGSKLDIRTFHRWSSYALASSGTKFFRSEIRGSLSRGDAKARKDGFAEKHVIWQNKCTKSAETFSKEKATFFPPSLDWCLPSPTKIKREERKCIVVSSASVQVLSKKELNSAELETVRP